MENNEHYKENILLRLTIISAIMSSEICVKTTKIPSPTNMVCLRSNQNSGVVILRRLFVSRIFRGP